MNNSKVAIISGITGQDGAYLSKLLLSEGYTVIGLTRSISTSNNFGLNYLGLLEKVELIQCDLLDITQVIEVLTKNKPIEVYNLAAQSSVSQSFSQPIGTINYNTMSVLNFLEAIRLVDASIKFYQASSSEMFGDINNLPISEESIFHPKSPYAISKASAHWLCVNYRESYGLFVACGILFNHESYLRSPNFFIKKVLRNSILISKGKLEELVVGNIEVKRDFGYAPKYVEAMYKMMQINKAENFLICSGKSVTLKSLIYTIFDTLNISYDRIMIDQNLIRPSEIPDIYGNPDKARNELGWENGMTHKELIEVLLEEELRNWD